MTASTGSSTYQRGLELAEAGQYGAALNCIQEHLRATPYDAQALNDAGAILHCLGRSRDAITYLIKARELQPDSGEIVWNLMEAYLAAGLAMDAVALVDVMEKMGLLNIDVVNRLATQLLNQGRKGPAVDILLKSQDLWPNQEILSPILDVIRSKRSKVAFFGCRSDDENGVGQICAFVQQRFQTEFFEPGRNDSDLLQWCDIAWFDGGGQKLVEVSRAPYSGKIVVSLRPSDLDMMWVKEVRWENVDILLQIGGSDVEEGLRRWMPNIRNRTRLDIIPTGVDVARYPLRSRPRGKHLACMGGLSREGNPGFLLQCMQKLHYIDPEYRLFFSGQFQDPILEQYLKHMIQKLGLVGVVHFERTPSDWNAWLSDKHFVVSSSIDKTSVEMLLIGMASGLKPVVHDFPGADQVFPSEYLFNIAEEFCQGILDNAFDPAKYHCFVEERYSIQEQFRFINGIMEQLECENEWQASDEFKAKGRPGSTPILAVGKPQMPKAMAANV